MRKFNTSGPCDPKLHYTLIRKELIAIGVEKVNEGRFFTIFAPRQTGKTTYFQIMFNDFKDTSIKPIYIMFGSLKELSKTRFYEMVTFKLRTELTKYNIHIEKDICDAGDMEICFNAIKINHSCQILLVIDEFEGIPDCVLNEFMHALRDMYHHKENHALHSMILVGVSTISDLVHMSASPFNIAEEIEIPYFRESETNELIDQYVAESGQNFDVDVRKAIYHNTNGQPGLVCALCSHLVANVALDRNKPVCANDFYPTLQYFLTAKYDKNVINIVQKANEKKNFMIKLLFNEEPIPFTVDTPDISFLFANGVLSNINGIVDIAVPLYKKRLITAMRPIINGETSSYFTNVRDNFDSIKIKDGLNIKALLEKYIDYIKRRGFKAFDTENLKESAWHYSLDGYINCVIEEFKGHTFIEVPSGRGRTDIIIVYGNNKYVIETKIYSTPQRFQDGKAQLAQYLKSEGLSEGFYVVFSKNHNEDDTLYEDEIVEGKRIYTFIIQIAFERPSGIAAQRRHGKTKRSNNDIIQTSIFEKIKGIVSQFMNWEK